MAIRAKHNQTEFKVGDTVRVKHTFREQDKDGEKTSSQTFEGLVISIKGRGVNKSITVRKIASDAIGVEKIWPLSSPSIKSITLKKQGKVRRAKLYYLRERKGKEALKVK